MLIIVYTKVFLQYLFLPIIVNLTRNFIAGLYCFLFESAAWLNASSPLPRRLQGPAPGPPSPASYHVARYEVLPRWTAATGTPPQWTACSCAKKKFCYRQFNVSTSKCTSCTGALRRTSWPSSHQLTIVTVERRTNVLWIQNTVKERNSCRLPWIHR